MKTSDFDYILPPELIAQTPTEPRDHSCLLVVDRQTGLFQHRHFFDVIDYLKAGDVLVFNDSRVIPARLNAVKPGTAGKLEFLLLRRLESNVWEALVKPAKRAKPGTKIQVISNGLNLKTGYEKETELKSENPEPITGEIVGECDEGLRHIRFSDEAALFNAGEIPLPPYIREPLLNKERYQTVYSRISGSAAAPTAGLHFTPELIKKLQDKGVECLFVTLHVGLDTFRPVREEDPQKHVIHKEFGILDAPVAQRLAAAKDEGRRIIAVGTTSVRVLEAAARASGCVRPFSGWIDLFILPGYRFKVVDTMVTNFHLPCTTLLMLVSAFAGKELLEKAYAEAIAEKYRFYSFGDSMMIL
jgi:S-adenosylmethionine:tRNA ribosyltransferase-isomerase